jgi:sigma-B regulation protein RsbU (phosphoserine phosphatase)
MLVIADAAGHDLAASLWTASLKALAAEYAGPVNLPLEIVRAINSSLLHILPPGAFFTLVYARVNHQTGRVSLINAGHPPAIVSRHVPGEPVILRQEGDVVGSFPDAVFGVTELTLQPGDRLFLYTDGLIENGSSYEEGLERLACACSMRQGLTLPDAIPAIVCDIASATAPVDDTLLMGVER